MSEEMLVCHCSPTLAGLKTGSLFSCPYSSQKMIIKEIREFNQKLTQKGIRIIPVRISDKRMLVYVYRPEKLKEDLKKDLIKFFKSKVRARYLFRCIAFLINYRLVRYLDKIINLVEFLKYKADIFMKRVEVN